VTGTTSCVLRRVEALGLSWALGLALFTALYFGLYLAGTPAVPDVCVVGLLTVGIVGAGSLMLRVLDRGVSVSGVTGTAGMTSGPRDILSSVVTVVCLGVATIQVGMACWLAARAPFGAWDAWSFWAFKARMFAAGGPRPGYFRDPLTILTHPDYPLNAPLAEAALLRVAGNPGVVLAALIGPVCLAALLLLLYAGLARLYGPAPAALAVAALSCIPELPRQAASGNADVPLAMYCGAATLYLLSWWRLRRPSDVVLMALLAGGGAWTKKEGLPIALLLLAACAAGEVLRYYSLRRGGRQSGATPRVSIRRALGVGLAALVLPLPWLVFCRVVHPLGRDFLPLTPAVFLTHAGRLPHIGAMFLLQTLAFGNWSLLWPLLAAALISKARLLSPAAWGLAALLLSQVGVYAVSFVFSDWQPYTAHIQTSLDRLLVQAAPLAVLLLVEVVTLPRTALPVAAGVGAAPRSRSVAA